MNKIAVTIVTLALLGAFVGMIIQENHITQLEKRVQDNEGKAGAAFPIPIPGYYIAEGVNGVVNSKVAPNSINDTQLAFGQNYTNFTSNITISALTGTALVPQFVNGSITLNRTAAVRVTVSGTPKTAAGNVLLMQVRLNQSTAPAGSNGSTMLPGQIYVGMFQDYNVTSFTVINNSVAAGTYAVELYGNSTSTGLVNFGNVTLSVETFPR